MINCYMPNSTDLMMKGLEIIWQTKLLQALKIFEFDMCVLLSLECLTDYFHIFQSAEEK